MWDLLCVWTVGCACVMGMCGTWCACRVPYVFRGSMWGVPWVPGGPMDMEQRIGVCRVPYVWT